MFIDYTVTFPDYLYLGIQGGLTVAEDMETGEMIDSNIFMISIGFLFVTIDLVFD